MQEEKTDEETATAGSVKSLSKWSMVFATVWIISGVILSGLGIIKLSVTDIIYSAIGIVGVWSPTYLSIWLDKIKEIKFGGEK